LAGTDLAGMPPVDLMATKHSAECRNVKKVWFTVSGGVVPTIDIMKKHEKEKTLRSWEKRLLNPSTYDRETVEAIPSESLIGVDADLRYFAICTK